MNPYLSTRSSKSDVFNSKSIVSLEYPFLVKVKKIN